MKHPQDWVKSRKTVLSSHIQYSSICFRPSAQRNRKVMGLENLIGYLGMFKDESHGGAQERSQDAEN
jgi:hypothetical protein